MYVTLGLGSVGLKVTINNSCFFIYLTAIIKMRLYLFSVNKCRVVGPSPSGFIYNATVAFMAQAVLQKCLDEKILRAR